MINHFDDQPVDQSRKPYQQKAAIPRPAFYSLAVSLILTVGLLIAVAVGGWGHIHGYFEAMNGLVAKVLTIVTPIVFSIQSILFLCLYSIDKTEFNRREKKMNGALMNSGSSDDSDSISGSGDELLGSNPFQTGDRVDLSRPIIVSDLEEDPPVVQLPSSISTSSTTSTQPNVVPNAQNGGQ